MIQAENPSNIQGTGPGFHALQVLELLQEIVLVLSLDGKVVYTNKNATKLFSSSKDKLSTLHITTLLKQCSIEHTNVEEWLQVFNSLNQDSSEIFRFEVAHGSRTIRWQAQRLQDKSTVNFLFSGQDISDYYRMRQRQRNVQTYLDNILTHIPCFIYWKDKQSRYLGCNENFAQVAGLSSADDIVGKSDFDLVWGKSQAELFRHSDQSVLNGQAKFNFEEPQLQADGSQAIVLASKVPMRDLDGNIIGILGIYVDITDRKKSEDALLEEKKKVEAANQAKTEFLAVMGHELRTPLNAIIGMAQLLSMGNMPEEEQEKVTIIFQAGLNLLDLINDILKISRGDTDKSAPKFKPYELPGLIKEVVSMLSQPAKEKNLNLLIEYSPLLGTSFMGDASHLRQILVNLINNAIKFTAQGYIQVRVLQSSILAQTLRIEVNDTGIGIPEDKLHYIFESFTQVDSSYSRPYAGMGLGLWIAKNLTERLGGEIGVASTLGQGSTFWIHLPLVPKPAKYPPLSLPERLPSIAE